MTRFRAYLVALGAAAAMAAACGGDKPPVARPTPPPPAPFPSPGGTGGTKPPAPPEPTSQPISVPADTTVSSDPLVRMTPDQINQQSPLKPVYFAYDSDEVDGAGRQTLNQDADVLKKYGTWVITIEGHCDERGTAEYNLSLGERRAIAAKNYLLSLGIGADRIRTVSYGREFPFDPGHEESAWSKNRRAHFMVTSK
jgi:peptidoglycan-associated lipoprotein